MSRTRALRNGKPLQCRGAAASKGSSASKTSKAQKSGSASHVSPPLDVRVPALLLRHHKTAALRYVKSKLELKGIAEAISAVLVKEPALDSV